MTKIIYTLLVSFISINLYAQEFEIPENVKLENQEDYKKYEQDILNAINWTQETPLREQESKRKEINAFLIKWMSGSPTVSIELSQDLVPFMDSAECLMSFMNGWTKYSLENNYSKDKVECAFAATNHTINFYKKNKKELGRISSIEKLIKKKKKERLKSYLISML